MRRHASPQAGNYRSRNRIENADTGIITARSLRCACECGSVWRATIKRDIKTLASKEYDLLVIGGGIFGACAAWDAALRGLSVALIDKEDFGCGSSAHSFKMVHGGIRYLQHADLKRLRSSCRERSAFLRIAPHLVHPLPILIPTYGHTKQGKAFLGTGMLVYDALTFDRNRGIRDPKRAIPLTRFMSRDQVIELFPDLKDDGLTGGAVFCDGQMYNPTRLVLAFVQSAASQGATVANHAEAVHLLRDGSTVTGARVRDGLTGDEIDVRARVTLNTAGPWAEALLEKPQAPIDVENGTYSRDAYFIVKRRFDNPNALAVQGRTRDPDAVMSRDARHLFVVPWRDFSLIGVWHVVYERGPEDISVDENELLEFAEEINWAYPSLQIKPDDILMCNAGLVPFGEDQADGVNLSYGKESRLIDHARTNDIDGLITLIGIRYTMGRGDAEKAVDIAVKKLGRHAKSSTQTACLFGGDIEDFDKLINEVSRTLSHGSNDATAEALAHNHGAEYHHVLSWTQNDPTLASKLKGTNVLRAEVCNAIHNEMAASLADIVFRRTDLATGRHPGTDVLSECAQLAAEHLGWSEHRIQQEISQVESQLSNRGMVIRRPQGATA